MPIDSACAHQEIHMRRGGDVAQRIARYRDDVSLLALRKYAHVMAL